MNKQYIKEIICSLIIALILFIGGIYLMQFIELLGGTLVVSSSPFFVLSIHLTKECIKNILKETF